jgi:hypothetical protein
MARRFHGFSGPASCVENPKTLVLPTYDPNEQYAALLAASHCAPVLISVCAGLSMERPPWNELSLL